MVIENSLDVRYALTSIYVLKIKFDKQVKIKSNLQSTNKLFYHFFLPF